MHFLHSHMDFPPIWKLCMIKGKNVFIKRFLCWGNDTGESCNLVVLFATNYGALLCPLQGKSRRPFSELKHALFFMYA